MNERLILAASVLAGREAQMKIDAQVRAAKLDARRERRLAQKAAIPAARAWKRYRRRVN